MQRSAKLYTIASRQLHQNARKVGRQSYAIHTCSSNLNPYANSNTSAAALDNETSKLAFSTKSAPPDSSKKESKCPFSQVRDLSSEAAATLNLNNLSLDTVTEDNSSSKYPTLTEVPSWPIIGSFFSIIPGIGNSIQRYYDVPELLPHNVYDFYATMNKQYGDFYAFDIPGIGVIHCINDPDEMIKVLRNEGAYPKGGISSLRPFIKWSKERNLTIVEGEDNGFFGQGETWKTLRTFMQTDMLSPQAAKGYVPAIVEAAQNASKAASHYEDDLNHYLNYCAFDMFQTVMFGEQTKIVDPHTPTDPINKEFVENSIVSLALMVGQMLDKSEVFKGKMGIVTPTYKRFEEAMDKVNEIANYKINTFKEKWERGELNEAEKASYIAHAFERQKAEGKVSQETMSEIAMLALNAGVDTTSTFICWALVHLSLNPEVQENLYKELKDNVEQNGGTLSSDMLSKTKSPYLHAVLRESHRLTPVHPTTMMKGNSTKEIEINGKTFPKGSLFQFDSFSKGIKPEYFENPDVFMPERWSAEAVEARKGTPSAIFDHQFYKDPFSQGARRCPGSRVAVNETLVLLSQLVLDWKFEPKENISSFKDVEYQQKTLVVPTIPSMKFASRN